MSSFIITEKSLDKNARKLMLDFYNHIQTDYSYVINHDDIEEQQKYWNDNLVDEYMSFFKIKNIRQIIDDDVGLHYSITYNTEDNIIEKLYDKFNDETGDIGDLRVLKGENLKKYIENEIKNKTIQPDFVYYFLKKIDEKDFVKHEYELDEDCYFLRKAFLKAYELFHYCGYNLKD